MDANLQLDLGSSASTAGAAYAQAGQSPRGRLDESATRMVRDAPGLYLACSRAIVLLHVGQIPQVFCQIFHDSFSGTAAAGARSASLNQVIQTGVKRAAFSSEAGLGTAPMGA